VALSACSSTSSGVPDGLPPLPTTNQATAFSGDGPYAAGVAIQTMPDGGAVVVTYPVDKSATSGKARYSVNLLRWFLGNPAAPVPSNLAALNLPTTLSTTAYSDVPVSGKGPFPVVLFSHGFGGYPEQSSFLTVHLATWGFVVVAPDHRSRDLYAVVNKQVQQCACDVTDLRRSLAYATALDHRAGSLLTGKLDLSRVASLGHSAGGGAALSVASDPAVRTYAALAPAPGTVPPAGKPGLLMQGANDQVVLASGTQLLYASLHTPKRLVLIDGAGHNVFADACTIGASAGGLVAIVRFLNLPADFAKITTDGCVAPDIAPPTAWPFIDQVVTAQLRWGLGVDPQPVGLSASIDDAYAGVTATVAASP
jgi:alpha-beta hydrolase superfamily lysophospholipase